MAGVAPAGSLGAGGDDTGEYNIADRRRRSAIDGSARDDWRFGAMSIVAARRPRSNRIAVGCTIASAGSRAWTGGRAPATARLEWRRRMIIMALDTSSRGGSAALVRDGAVV